MGIPSLCRGSRTNFLLIVSAIGMLISLSFSRVAAFRGRAFKGRTYSKSSLQMETTSVKIIGGGLAGLATAYHLANSGECSKIVVTDTCSSPGDGGASAVAAGLIHPFTPSGKIIYRGLEGLKESLELINLAQKHSNAPLVSKGANIMRPCYTEKAYDDWRKAAEVHSEWLSEIAIDEFFQTISSEDDSSLKQSPRGVFLIENAYLIDTPRYLRCLWKAMQAKFTEIDLLWESENVKDVREHLNSCDVVVVASGVGVSKLWPLGGGQELPFKYIRGQNLYYKRSHTDIGEAAVLCGEYVCPIGEDLVCGATHEYGETVDSICNMPPDTALAVSLLLEKLTRLVPKLDHSSPYRSKAGIRVTSKRTHHGKLPVIAEHPDYPRRLWMLTGFGSRGLIHHALLGKILSQAIVGHQAIPEEILSSDLCSK